MEQTDVIKVFLSYAHKDEEFYQFIRKFKSSLEYLVPAYSKNSIEVFLDRESILWGEQWHGRILNELNDAPVFVPVVSSHYLRSKNCREEFLEFYSGAKEVGVTELILPVLIVGSDVLDQTQNDDEIFKICRELQWVDFSTAIACDSNEATWKKSMQEIAEKFIKSYNSAEPKIIQRAEDSASADQDREQGTEVSDDGLLDLFPRFMEETDGLTKDLHSVKEYFEELTEAANGFQTDAEANPRQIQLAAINLARSFDKPAREIEEAGARIFQRTSSIDEIVRKLRAIEESAPPEMGLPDMASLFEGISDLEESREQLQSMLNSMKSAEVMSAAVRRSLRPVRSGVTKMTDSIELMMDWKDMNLPSN